VLVNAPATRSDSSRSIGLSTSLPADRRSLPVHHSLALPARLPWPARWLWFACRTAFCRTASRHPKEKMASGKVPIAEVFFPPFFVVALQPQGSHVERQRIKGRTYRGLRMNAACGGPTGVPRWGSHVERQRMKGRTYRGLRMNAPVGFPRGSHVRQRGGSDGGVCRRVGSGKRSATCATLC